MTQLSKAGASSFIQYGIFSIFCLLLAVTQYANFLQEEDATTLFNFFNNSTERNPFFFYAGYISVYPHLVGYLASIFPFKVQGFIYLVAAIAFGVFFLVQTRKYFGLFFDFRTSIYLALLLGLLVDLAAPNTFGNVVFSIWPTFIAAAICIFRVNASKDTYSVVELIFVILAVTSWPGSSLLIPILLLNLFRQSGRGSRLLAANLAILLAVVVFISFFITKGNLQFDVVASVVHLLSNFFTQYKKSALMLTVALAEGFLFLFVLIRLHIAKRKVFSLNEVILLLSGMYVAYAHLGIFLLSNRALSYDGIPGHQVTLSVFFSTSAILILLSPRIRSATLELLKLSAYKSPLCSVHRFLPAIVALSFLYLCLGRFGLGNIDRYGFPAILDSVSRFQYLAQADEFRKNCEPGSAFALERDYWSLVVLCRSSSFPVGMHKATVSGNNISFWRDVVWHREPVKDRVLGSIPVIFVGETLFSAGKN